MLARKSKQLVIDASVARSSGGPSAAHPTASICRDFLLRVLTVCHSMIMTPAIRDEWNRHQSAFARTWRASMVARRKLRLPSVYENEGLRNRIGELDVSQRVRRVLLKDFPLVEAALAVDDIVISLDDEARRYYADAAETIKDLRAIVWVNPHKGEDDLIAWLEGGAQVEAKRLLWPGRGGS